MCYHKAVVVAGIVLKKVLRLPYCIIAVGGTVRKVRRELKNCVRTERLHGVLDTMYGRLKSLEYKFNLLLAQLASNHFDDLHHW